MDGRFKGATELIGVVAVVASLVFVGLEVRQNSAAVRGATQQQLAAGAREVNALVVGDPTLAELHARSSDLADWSSLSPAEQTRLGMWFVALFRVHEDAYYQRMAGNLDPLLWTGWQRSLSMTLARPNSRYFWSTSAGSFNDDFRALVDSILNAN